jgi:small subunit ribosomal protein S16
MVVIRLARAGRKGTPVYKITVSEKGAKLKGRFLEKLGTYKPSTSKADFDFNPYRYSYWISKGAQSSPRVLKLLKDQKVEIPAAGTVEPVKEKVVAPPAPKRTAPPPRPEKKAAPAPSRAPAKKGAPAKKSR